MARPLLERALAVREGGLGPDHTATGWVLLDLGRVPLLAGRLEEARALFQRALGLAVPV